MPADSELMLGQLTQGLLVGAWILCATITVCSAVLAVRHRRIPLSPLILIPAASATIFGAVSPSRVDTHSLTRDIVLATAGGFAIDFLLRAVERISASHRRRVEAGASN